MCIKLKVSAKDNSYILGEKYEIFADWLVIPKGFRWRVRSLPRWCWKVTVGSPYCPSAVRAAMVREFLFFRRDVSGACNDNMFLNIMLEDGVSKPKAYCLYYLARASRLFK